MFTLEQSNKALHYSIKWLEQEIIDVEIAIDNCNDIVSAKLLNGRLQELKSDYKQFQELNQ